MTRYFLFFFALGLAMANGAEAAAPTSATQGGSPGDPYYCPPGAKFCPVPGRDNTVYLDTHFGMDAATGEVKAYRGTVHPDEVTNNLTVREEMLYKAPPISVENRQVPWPGTETYSALAAPQERAYSQSSQPSYQPVPQTRPVSQAQEIAYRQPPGASESSRAMRTEPVDERGIPWWKGGWWRKDDSGSRSAGNAQAAEVPNSRAFPAPTSEVANQQSSRESVTPWEGTVGEDKVPWWKGGWWRNRGGDDDDSPPPPPPRRSESRRGGSQTPPPVTPDDMWGDDDYSAYNPDFASPDVSWQTQQQGAPQYQQSPGYAQDPYAQPPMDGYSSEPYTLPNSPPPSSPYEPGYVYPGSGVSYENTYQGGYSANQPPPQTSNGLFSAPAPTYSDPYSAPSPYSDPFSAPAPSPSYQPSPSFIPPPPAPMPADSGASGGPQFENAVRMVKDSRFTEAKQLLTSETSSNPRNAAAWRWLGDCHYNLLELPQAIDSYQRAIQLDPNDYYAMRGQGFANLHRGHELWRKMMEEMNMGQREQAASTFSQAHDHYKRALELLSDCLRRAPNDGEAVYGEAMAAEGASRKLYSNAISYIKLGPENRERAELFAENCLQVINKGVERANERAKQNPGEVGPRALLGGLHLRKAMLYHQLGKRDLALGELINSHTAQKSILDEIDKNNATALKGVQDCQTYWSEWGGTGSLN